MKFCPTCDNYLSLKESTRKEEGSDATHAILTRVCRTCGYQEDDEKGGLIYETNLREYTSDSWKVVVNEFTKEDPTLPHVNSIKCPNQTCSSNTAGKEGDVIYIKTDAVNLKFLYICMNCNTQWRSS
jgi:DNA-directed RNA polymerase subunit M/transcription elongation factor TFIIS